MENDDDIVCELDRETLYELDDIEEKIAEQLGRIDVKNGTQNASGIATVAYMIDKPMIPGFECDLNGLQFREVGVIDDWSCMLQRDGWLRVTIEWRFSGGDDA